MRAVGGDWIFEVCMFTRATARAVQGGFTLFPQADQIACRPAGSFRGAFGWFGVAWTASVSPLLLSARDGGVLLFVTTGLEGGRTRGCSCVLMAEWKEEA